MSALNAKQQAFEDLKTLSGMLKGIIAIGGDLDGVGSLEQAENEAKGRMDAARVEERNALEAMNAAREREEEAKAGLAKVQEEMAALKGVMEAYGAESRAKAEGEAEQIVKDAKADAANMIAQARAAVVAIAEEGDRLRAALAPLDAAISEKKGQMDVLQAMIKQMKAQITSIG